eukprot:TRINITY_DN10277_c0_g1_i1.p1 TRINITY_DN10277_c0_g1~~TRINITY_DN10277_c0_g1_i1.p1  ORF type:complete len:277 (+),score=59.12 TRINITY_DN10277_c0_g1_i1:241-1071(+)
MLDSCIALFRDYAAAENSQLSAICVFNNCVCYLTSFRYALEHNSFPSKFQLAHALFWGGELKRVFSYELGIAAVPTVADYSHRWPVSAHELRARFAQRVVHMSQPAIATAVSNGVCVFVTNQAACDLLEFDSCTEMEVYFYSFGVRAIVAQMTTDNLSQWTNLYPTLTGDDGEQSFEHVTTQASQKGNFFTAHVKAVYTFLDGKVVESARYLTVLHAPHLDCGLGDNLLASPLTAAHEADVVIDSSHVISRAENENFVAEFDANLYQQLFAEDFSS